MGSKGLTLYEIPEAFREIENALIEAEGELTPEIEARLDALEDAVDRKVEYMALISREAKAEAAAVKQEEDRLRARRTAAENREKRIKDYLHACLTKLGRDRVEGERIKVRIQPNGNPSVEWMGEEDGIPEAFRVVTVAPNKALALDTFKAGGAVPDGFRIEYGSHCRVW